MVHKTAADKDVQIKRKVELLYYAYRSKMFQISLSILRDHFLAEDAVHEAFLRIIKNIYKIEEVENYKTKAFVNIIVKNVSLSMLKSSIRKKVTYINEFDYIFSSNDLGIEDKILADEDLKIIKKQLSTIDIKYSDPIVLRYIYGYTHKEISEILGISHQNARMRCHRAIKIIKTRLREEA